VNFPLHIYIENARGFSLCSPGVLLTVMWLLKLRLDLKLLLLTFNLFVILKATSQLREYQENTRRTPSISLYIYTTYMYVVRGFPCVFLDVLPTVIRLLKSPSNLKLSLLSFNLLVILKAISQLGEH
jgi:hypothetical protein